MQIEIVQHRRCGRSEDGSILAYFVILLVALRQQAANLPTGEIRCTLCDGRGTMRSCVLCSGYKGKCVTCNGSGKLSDLEDCPTCLGDGNCFLCAGTRKMTCPFCDDGMMSANRPMPSGRMPID